MRFGNKFGAIKTNGYASKKEANRARELELWAKCGAITDLRQQVTYELIPKQEGERSVTYRADFVYRNEGALVVEDTKGFRTKDYIIKRKLMLWIHGIRVTEI